MQTLNALTLSFIRFDQAEQRSQTTSCPCSSSCFVDGYTFSRQNPRCGGRRLVQRLCALYHLNTLILNSLGTLHLDLVFWSRVVTCSLWYHSAFTLDMAPVVRQCMEHNFHVAYGIHTIRTAVRQAWMERAWTFLSGSHMVKVWWVCWGFSGTWLLQLAFTCLALWHLSTCLELFNWVVMVGVRLPHLATNLPQARITWASLTNKPKTWLANPWNKWVINGDDCFVSGTHRHDGLVDWFWLLVDIPSQAGMHLFARMNPVPLKDILDLAYSVRCQRPLPFSSFS